VTKREVRLTHLPKRQSRPPISLARQVLVKPVLAFLPPVNVELVAWPMLWVDVKLDFRTNKFQN
jgi:hypothetical protein